MLPLPCTVQCSFDTVFGCVAVCVCVISWVVVKFGDAGVEGSGVVGCVSFPLSYSSFFETAHVNRSLVDILVVHCALCTMLVMG